MREDEKTIQRLKRRLGVVQQEVTRRAESSDPASESRVAHTFLRMRTSLRKSEGTRQADGQDRLIREEQRIEHDRLGRSSYPIPSHPVELRAVWHRPIEKSQESIEHVLDRLGAAGFNAVFLGVLWGGRTIWPSRRMEQHARFVGQDPLVGWIRAAQRRGMQLHGWMQMFNVGDAFEAGPVLTAQPDWAALQMDGELFSRGELGQAYVDPAHPEVRRFLLDAIKELMSAYDLAGLHIDSVAHPASYYFEDSFSYSPWSRNRFRAQYGIDPLDMTPDSEPELWAAWRTCQEEHVTSFVREVRDLTLKTWPERILSVAVVADATMARKANLQYWPGWAAEGLVDCIVPRFCARQEEKLASLTTEAVYYAGSQVLIVAGIGAHRSGAGALPVEQIGTAHESGSWGSTCLSLHALSENDLDQLSKGPYRTAAIPPHHPNALCQVITHVMERCHHIMTSDVLGEARTSLQLCYAHLEALLDDAKQWPLPYDATPTRAMLQRMTGRMRVWLDELAESARLIHLVSDVDDTCRRPIIARLRRELQKVEDLIRHHLGRMQMAQRVL